MAARLYGKYDFVSVGRCSGKTLALQLRLIFDEETEMIINSHNKHIYIMKNDRFVNKREIEEYERKMLLDDSDQLFRKKWFYRGLYDIYLKLESGGMKLKKIKIV